MTNNNCNSFDSRFEALIAGELDADERLTLKQHAESCLQCRTEYEWLLITEADLGFLGNDRALATPKIDVIQDVMSRLESVAPPARPTATLRVVPKPFPKLAWGSLAAAAAILLAIAYFALPNQTDVSQTAREDNSTTVPTAQEPMLTTSNDDETMNAQTDDTETLVVTQDPQIGDDPLTPTPPPARAPMDRATIWATFTDTLVGGDPQRSEEALRELMDLAKLDLEQARELLEDPDAPLEARAFSATEYPSVEMADALYQVVGSNSPNSHMRLQVARAYRNSGETHAAELEQYAALEVSDPENALSPYWQAEYLLSLDPPDTEGAKKALEYAASLDSVYAFTAETAQGRELALIQSGVDPETARLLAALTAGRTEYNELTSVASNLLSYGDQYRDLGDFETAESIYNAVLLFGEQIDAGASFSQEALAGVDVQQDALSSLRELNDETGNVANIEEIVNATGELLYSTEALLDHFNQLDSILTGTLPDDSLLGRIADIILGSGDLNILEFLGDIALN